MSFIEILHQYSKSYRRKKWKIQDESYLLERIATLLEEGYVLIDSITMLLPYHVKNSEHLHNEIQVALQNGASVVEVFDVLKIGKRYLLAISLAELNGTLSATLFTISKQIRFEEELKARLVKILVYPITLFIFISLLFIGFRLYFLPNIAALLNNREMTGDTTTIRLSKWLLHVPDYISVMCLLVATIVIGYSLYIRRKRIDLQVQILSKIPVIQYFWRLLLTKSFAKSLGSLLVMGLSMQQAIRYLSEQQMQPQLAYIANIIGKRIIFGDSLTTCVQLVNLFFPKFEQFVHHGEKSGYLGRELLIYCELLDAKLNQIIQRLVGIIQPLLFIIIAICVVAAYLSILLPIYNMMDTI